MISFSLLIYKDKVNNKMSELIEPKRIERIYI